MPSPIIISAVSRFIAVSDLDVTGRFYRDTLGFEQRPSGEPVSLEFIRGPARIVAKVGDTSFDSTGGAQPRGSAIVFFQVDDVAAMRDEISGRGGATSPLEKANWLKMRLFELRDPDGHVIWFGQSYHVDTEPRHVSQGKGQLRQLLPQLPLSDVAAGVAYYKEVLGFEINYAQSDLGVMYRDSVTLLLISRSPAHSGIGSCSAYVADADKLYQELKTKGARVLGEPVSQPWGLRDFTVVDLEGNRLTFGQPFE